MAIQLKALPDQVMVITGATSGIGLATARMAARRRARLVLVARNEGALRIISDDLNMLGAQTIHVAADVANEADLQRVADAAIERFGGFDSWINIAGVGIFGKSEDVSTEDMRRLFEVNFWGVVHGSMIAARHLKMRGGALINMGSETSDRAVPLLGIYSASKHAVKGFTDSLRTELEEEGAPVSVTLIKPASVDTMFVAHAKNYLDVEPQLPPPVYAPEVAAEAVLYAAEHPVRDLYVGSRARLSGAGAHHMPGLLDKGMKRFMIPMMKTDRPPRDREDNNLHTHSTDLMERSGAGKAPREISVYTSAVTHPRTTGAVMVGTGLALAALLRMRRRQRVQVRKSLVIADRP